MLPSCDSQGPDFAIYLDYGIDCCFGNHGDLIVSVVAREEEGFDRTLRAGLSRLEEALATGTKVLGGDVAFTLHDTHGFPVELTEELARDAGVAVDRAGFDAAMAEQAHSEERLSKVTHGCWILVPLGGLAACLGIYMVCAELQAKRRRWRSVCANVFPISRRGIRRLQDCFYIQVGPT